MLLCDGTDLAHTTDIAERIRSSIAEHVVTLADGQQLGVTASFGVHVVYALAATENAGHLPLIEAADRALYRAKENGRNRVECAQEAMP